MPAHWTVSKNGVWEKIAEKLARKAEGNPIYEITTEVNASATRGRADNFRILFVQLNKYKRNPWFIAKDMQEKLHAAIQEALRLSGVAGLSRVAQEFAAAIVDGYRKHIETEQSKQGAMPPLAQGTIEHKRRAGHGNNPILWDTGELIGALAFRVRELT